MIYLVLFLILLFLLLYFFMGFHTVGLVAVAILLIGGGFALYGFLICVQKYLDRQKTGQAVEIQDSQAEGGEGSSRIPGAGFFKFPSNPLSGSAPKSIVNLFSERGNPMDRFFVRGLIIAGITLALLIPLSLVSDMVSERSHMRRTAIEDIEQSWGGVQRISGPVLVIPFQRRYSYSEIVKDKDGNNVSVTKVGYSWKERVILPARVDFNSVLSPKKRYRGIYEHVVYSTPIRISGTFRLPTAESFGEDASRIDWHRTWFAIGVGDLKGITSETPLVWEKKSLGSHQPGTGVKNLIGPGFHTQVPLIDANSGKDQDFSLDIALNGSGGLYFTPVGETTKITVSGKWPHPSFAGNLLPTTRSITDSDFKGEWIIPHLSRTYPQSGIFGDDSFDGSSSSITSFTAGINLFETVSLYTQTQRAVKYGVLFIGLTFVALFAFELITKVRMHFLQYGLVGISMTVFYLVLLSLAEHTSFIMAFAAASAVTVFMNSLYIAAAQKSWIKGAIMAFVLSALYTLLYTLLRMEDYALLIGTAIVLIALGALMFLTRNLPVQGEAGKAEKRPEADTPA